MLVINICLFERSVFRVSHSINSPNCDFALAEYEEISVGFGVGVSVIVGVIVEFLLEWEIRKELV